MKIRPAQRQDLAEIATIHAASWSEAYSGILPADYLVDQVHKDLQAHWEQQEIRPLDVVLVADISDRLEGFIAVWCRPTPFIDNLHISRSVRSQGIGTALMRAAAARLVALGHTTAYLWVFESNVAAIRFYERLGAVRVREGIKEVFGHGVPSVRMEWSDLRPLCIDA